MCLEFLQVVYLCLAVLPYFRVPAFIVCLIQSRVHVTMVLNSGQGRLEQTHVRGILSQNIALARNSKKSSILQRCFRCNTRNYLAR
jgi:hypothetical protein